MLKHFPALPLQTDQALAETFAGIFDPVNVGDVGLTPFYTLARGLFGFILAGAPIIEGRRQLGWIPTDTKDLSDDARNELLSFLSDEAQQYPVEAGATSYVLVRGETRQGLLTAIGFQEGPPGPGGVQMITCWDVFVYPYPYPANIG